MRDCSVRGRNRETALGEVLDARSFPVGQWSEEEGADTEQRKKGGKWDQKINLNTDQDQQQQQQPSWDDLLEPIKSNYLKIERYKKRMELLKTINQQHTELDKLGRRLWDIFMKGTGNFVVYDAQRHYQKYSRRFRVFIDTQTHLVQNNKTPCSTFIS